MGTLVVLLIGCFAILALTGLIVFVLKVGVVIQKAGEPPHRDRGTYTIEQGREVKGTERPGEWDKDR